MLAKKLKRDRSAVTRDVQILERFGVIQVTEKPPPGHGRQKWDHAAGIKAIADATKRRWAKVRAEAATAAKAQQAPAAKAAAKKATAKKAPVKAARKTAKKVAAKRAKKAAATQTSVPATTA